MTQVAGDNRKDDIVLIDFWAEWCGACRLIAPVIDRIAKNDGQLRLRKVNVEDDAETAARLGVKGLPTLVFIDSSGRELGRLTGSITGRTIEAALADARAAT
jgi:thioredoxin 1